MMNAKNPETLSLLYSAKGYTARLWLALGLSASLHCAAVAFAKIYRAEVMPSSITNCPDFSVTAFVEPVAPDILATPEIEEAPLSPINDEFFPPEILATPPPVRNSAQRLTKVAPLRSRSVAVGSATFSTAKVLALFAPRPEYPYQARRAKLTGSGVALFSVNPTTGQPVEVKMSVSTGSSILDQTTIAAFRRWRFPPGTAATVRCPISYTLGGAVF